MLDYRAMYYGLTGKLADVIDMLMEIQQAEEDAILEDASFAVLPEGKTTPG